MSKLKTSFLIFVSILLTFLMGYTKIKTVAQTGENNLPNWRGFNLLGKYTLEWSNNGFNEKDFEMMRQLNFNFARLPLDFRTYTVQGNWLSFQETELQKIDKAIEWGQKYGVHICINLHRVPGYCVNTPQTPLPADENLNLWTDTVAQNVFYAHWEMFAKRYKNIPASDLSFNLVNEPSGVESTVYAGIMKKAAEKIWESGKDRMIIVDGLENGREPINELVGTSIIQSFHMYDPMLVTHYKASWINGSDTWDVPKWPLEPFALYLYGPDKADLKTPLVINGNFKQNTNIIIRVGQVSFHSRLLVKADGKIVFDKTFIPGQGTGEWSKVVQVKLGYQNIYNKDYFFILTKDAGSLSISNIEGDWMTIPAIRLAYASDTLSLNPVYNDWGTRQDTMFIAKDGTITGGKGKIYDEYPLIEKWINFSRSQKVKIIVGEFGVYKYTPHDVTLKFLEGELKLFYNYRIPWVLWNFNGNFGPINSGRNDVQYENFQGYKLDRGMLDLLQKY
jgi:hypothetical protein